MKRSIIFLTIIFLLSGCSNNSANLSLSKLPDSYNINDAKSDNCVVFRDGDITSGQSVWDDFISLTDNGKYSTVRLAFYYTLGDPSQYSEELYEEIKDDYPVLYIKDLNFNGEKYILEGYEDGQMNSREYKYLMKYEGRPNSVYATFSEYSYYVLVNDDTVTWDDIEQGIFSSQYGDYIDHFIVYSDLVFK